MAVESGPAVRIVDLILHSAVVQKASDIHIAPTANTAKVRFRIDGCLRHYMQLPLPTLSRVISRIKILGGIDITNRLRPQDGKTRIEVDHRAYDLRISTVPTRGNEKAVIRVLDTQSARRLEDLSLTATEVQDIRSLVSHREGMVFLTGPTGSGKTTTLYAALLEAASEEVNVMTVEDPVEYDLPSVTQIQVDPKQGVTFSSALRALLRQDPDVILLGEIRDTETAKVAVQASMTGHLVLATVHTNDAIGCLRRCVDLGLDLPSIVETLRGAVAQRLLRRVCPDCFVTVDGEMTEEESRLTAAYGVRPMVRSRGCERCGNTGYRGRIPVTEVFTMNEQIEKLVLDGAPPSELQSAAIAGGMRPLFRMALERVRTGETTLQEVERALTNAPDEPADHQMTAEARTVTADSSKQAPPVEADVQRPGPRVDVVSSEGPDRVQPPHILLVDDDAINRAIARALLEGERCRVSETSDGDEALEFLKADPDLDLVVLDLDMPRLGGREVLARARGSLCTAGLPIIVLTGSGDPDAEVDLMREGADDYIRKPIEPRRFTARVMAALRRAKG